MLASLTQFDPADVRDQYLPLSAGAQLREYVVQSVLGRGGLGVTYQAWDTLLDRTVVIKECRPTDINSDRGAGTSNGRRSAERTDPCSDLDSFLEEARTLARVDHPNIVRVLSYFQANSTAYIVMPYQGGRDLASFLAEGKRNLHETEVRGILEPLLDGLEAAHAIGLLHGDIKPRNIVIRQDQTPMLIDFGAARWTRHNRHKGIATFVSPGYSPVEIYRGFERLGPWTDLYALAAVVYEMVSGRVPPNALSRVDDDRLTPLSDLIKATYSPGLLLAVKRALMVHPEDRPQTVAEFRALLRTAGADPSDRAKRRGLDVGHTRGNPTLTIGGAGVSAGATAHIEGGRSSGNRKRSGSIVAAAAAALIFAGGVAAYVYEKEGDTERQVRASRTREQALLQEVVEARQLAQDLRGKLEAAQEARQKAEEGARRQAQEARHRQLEDATRRAATVEAAEQDFVVVSDAYLREGPSTETQQVGMLVGGTRVTVTGKVRDANWYRVELANGMVGYVFGSLLRKPETTSPAPQQQDSAARSNKGGHLVQNHL